MGDRLLNGGPALLVRHLEKEQKRQLLDIVAVRQPVIAQDVTIVPEFLNELVGLVGHEQLLERTSRFAAMGLRLNLEHGQFPAAYLVVPDWPSRSRSPRFLRRAW